jgi:hypothetical protein
VNEIILLIEKMVGNKISSVWGEAARVVEISQMGHSQFNELLLSYGCDTVSKELFNHLWGSSIESVEHLRKGVDKFREMALLLYGSVVFGYKDISPRSGKNFEEIMKKINPVKLSVYKDRHAPIYPIKEISGDETRFNGYLLQGEIKKRMENPDDLKAISLWDKVKEVSITAKYNHNAYLCSDHMDVYVATSMRQPHEYEMVNEFCRHIFSPEVDLVKDLKLRWFDPTQACCDDRTEKGLSEALMLKRSKCTIYLIQESDTLGKASEMASTLAQGKTVIAYVPSVTSETEQKWKEWVTRYSKNPIFEDFGQDDILRSLAQTYCNDTLMNTTHSGGGEFRDWYFKRKGMQVDAIVNNIVINAGLVWNKRASTLKSDHPLGIQVNLDTGVANGVLVARTENQCMDLIRGVMLNTLEFDITDGMGGNLELREKITGCIYRVSSNDPVLVNSFWNYYLRK